MKFICLLTFSLIVHGLVVAAPAEGPGAAAVTLPEPPVSEPKYDGEPVAAPEGAIILFSGKDFSSWLQLPTKERPDHPPELVLWKLEKDSMEVVPFCGMICTKGKPITSGHLHLEWATPAEVVGEGQGRGNSGVFIEGIPELQILDSFNNPTYPDGQAAAFYRSRPPLLNVSRKPGEWQSYDIHLQRATVVDGKITIPASVTVYHNNVLVHDRVIFENPTQAGNMRLQDKNPVRFRNIWFKPTPNP